MQSISDLILPSIIGAFVLMSFFVIEKTRRSRRKIMAKRYRLFRVFSDKIGKVPAFIEIVSKHTPHRDVFIELIELHKRAIIAGNGNLAHMLELNARIDREFRFAMRISAKIPGIHRDGVFLYIRNFVIFYDHEIRNLIETMESEIHTYERLRLMKRFTVFGNLVPFPEIKPILGR